MAKSMIMFTNNNKKKSQLRNQYTNYCTLSAM